MMVEIDFLKSKNGDCFILKYNGTNILIDGGTRGVYPELKNKLRKLKQIDLLVVTHIDNDHIGGIEKLFEVNDSKINIKKVYFNSGAFLGDSEIEDRKRLIKEATGNKSYKQGINLEKKLQDLNIWDKEPITNNTKDLKLGPINIKVLAPFKENIEALNKDWDKEAERMEKEKAGKKAGVKETYEDIKTLLGKTEEIETTITNESSIVLLIEVDEKKILFTGDTSSANLLRSLKELEYSKDNPIKLDLFKLPHHGSKKNLSKELVEMIDCKKYLIPTNGKAHGHPDKETLARIIDFNKDKDIEFIFNYDVYEPMFSKQDEEMYDKFKCKKEKIVKI